MTTNSKATYYERDPDLRQQVGGKTNFQLQCWITGRHNEKGWIHSRTKRIIDIFITMIGLIILFPLMIVIALAVKLTSPGPIFFTQERTGYMGRRFSMYKFRTMVDNADDIKANLSHLSHHAKESPDFKIKNDPRITTVGLFLRKYSLDELPQIYNVVEGDMSLVGPRPTSFCVKTYEPHHMPRLASRPGLTCIWQISGRSNIDFNGRVDLDRRYIENQGPLQDLIILIKTPLAVLKADGAY
ncbi:MAG: sugar transferase [Pseudomonadales bacterium]|nr:sugar transferase [Pseudomonadales bacterium]